MNVVLTTLSQRWSVFGKMFLENYQFFRKSGNNTNSRGSCSLCHYDAMRTKIDMWFTLMLKQNFCYRIICSWNHFKFCGDYFFHYKYYWWTHYDNSKCLLTVKYCHKEPHFRCCTGYKFASENLVWNYVWKLKYHKDMTHRKQLIWFG